MNSAWLWLVLTQYTGPKICSVAKYISAFAWPCNRTFLNCAFFPLFRDRPEDRGEASTRRWTSTRAMYPAWKKRSLYCERYRQRTKTCNVQVSCTTRALHGRAHVAISCGKFRLDSTYVTSGRGIPPHRRLRFSPPLKEAPFWKRETTRVTRTNNAGWESKKKKGARSIYCTGCLGYTLSCQSQLYYGPNFSLTFTNSFTENYCTWQFLEVYYYKMSE